MNFFFNIGFEVYFLRTKKLIIQLREQTVG